MKTKRSRTSPTGSPAKKKKKPSSRGKTPAQIVDTVLEVLNEAHRHDPAAVDTLIHYHAPCNKWVAFHGPVKQVFHEDANGHFSIGMLGVLNAIVERLTCHRIAAIFSRSAVLPPEFSRLSGFKKVPKK